jgi:hypothetical protein
MLLRCLWDPRRSQSGRTEASPPHQKSLLVESCPGPDQGFAGRSGERN